MHNDPQYSCGTGVPARGLQPETSSCGTGVPACGLKPIPARVSKNRLCLAIIIVIYLILAGLYSALTPAATAIQHNADENAHMLYVQTLAAHRLPVFRAGQDNYEAHQPPLYYMLCLPVYLATAHAGDAVSTKAVRWVSIIFGALLILVTYKTVRLLAPHNSPVALLAAAFVGFLPGNVALCAAVTNDTLSNLLVAVALWKLVSMVTRLDKERSRLRKAILLGLAIGLGIWTKTTTLVLFPTVLFAFALLVFWKRLPVRAAVQIVAISLGVGIIIGLPWLIRNQILYGDPIAQHLFISSFGNTMTADPIMRGLGSATAYFQIIIKWTFASFWGVFDSMHLFLGQNPHGRTPSILAPLSILYLIIEVGCVCNLVGVFAFARGRLRRVTPEQKTAIWTMAILTAAVGYGFLRFILIFFQAQGRYLYPALVPIALFTAIGLRGLFPRRALYIAAAITVAVILVALNIYSLFWLIGPRFGTS